MPGQIARTGFGRMRSDSSFDSTCVVRRAGVTIYPSVPCIVETPNDRNQQLDGQSIPVGAFIVGMGVEHIIEQGDQIIEKGRVMEVIFTATPKSYEVRLDVICIKIADA